MTNKDMKQHLKDLSMSMAKAVNEYAATTNKLATMQTELWKEIGLKVEKIKSLEETIADKEETIEYYSDQNSELIGRVNEVEDELKACKGTETSRAEYEKKFKAFIGQKVDN
jgi:predicted nuclease with TOPRIM domain|tara:strand:+ start:980 stop:1315 length:336 start_codon:yes stop_codon:yes gene_type:complete